MQNAAQLNATYEGFIGSTYDALILFEACLSGLIDHVARRPHDREREHVIKSGQVFIYEEHSSGIKRWTDGISWSPSRILGNFLIYRQLVRAFGPGEKKKALKKPKGLQGISKNTNNSRKNSVYSDNGNPVMNGGGYGQAGTLSAEHERALIGSLTDSYDFMQDGLVKKTISVTLNGVTHHLVSYYTIADAMEQKLRVPSKDGRFNNIQPRAALMQGQNFRSPIEDVDPMDRSTYPRNRYEMTNQSMLGMAGHMPMMTTEPHSSYAPASSLYNGTYGLPAVSTPFENCMPAYSNAGYGHQYPPTPGIYTGTQRLDSYNGAVNGDQFRSRYSTVSSVSSDGSRAQMPTSSTSHRRASTYTQAGSEDSGISMSMDRPYNSDSSSSQGHSAPSYYPTPTTMAPQKALPSISQTDYSRQALYERPAINSYRMPVDTKESIPWTNGNASVGHGHYQAQWTQGH